MLFASLALNANAKAKGNKLNFESEQGSLLITNSTNQDVVVFVGKVERNLVLGGIRSGEGRSFNLSKLPDIPKSGSLLVKIVSYNTYKKGVKITEDDVVYTRLVVYDLTNEKEKSVFTIPSNVDIAQKHCIYLTNPTSFVLEVRAKSPMGEVIAVLPPMQFNKRVFLLPKDDGRGYDLFPVFVYRDVKTGRWQETTPSRIDMEKMIPSLITESGMKVQFRVPSSDDLSCDVAFITIKNYTDAGMEFYNGRMALHNQRGSRFSAPGNSDVYELYTGIEEDRKHTKLICVFDSLTEKPIDYTFNPRFVYEMILTGKNRNYQYEVKEIGKRNLLEDAGIELFMED